MRSNLFVFLLAISTISPRLMGADAKPSAVQPKQTIKTDAEWKKLLTPAQYHILRENGTEPAFTGSYWNNHDEGVYKCAACGLDVFESKTKFNSGTGWPSFWAPTNTTNVKENVDDSYGMHRTEVVCGGCGSHLGHVFEDGPKPTGLRYCINSICLKFFKK